MLNTVLSYTVLKICNIPIKMAKLFIPDIMLNIIIVKITIVISLT